MDSKRHFYRFIIVVSILAGVFISICDYLVQMTTTETSYFVSRILTLDQTILNLASYGCIFMFPSWIAGMVFVYKAGIFVNKNLSLIISICIVYALLMLSFYHYSYIVIDRVGAFSSRILPRDWDLLNSINAPFNPFMFILFPLSWIIIGLMSLSKKSIIPVWTIDRKSVV